MRLRSPLPRSLPAQSPSELSPASPLDPQPSVPQRTNIPQAAEHYLSAHSASPRVQTSPLPGLKFPTSLPHDSPFPNLGVMAVACGKSAARLQKGPGCRVEEYPVRGMSEQTRCALPKCPHPNWRGRNGEKAGAVWSFQPFYIGTRTEKYTPHPSVPKPLQVRRKRSRQGSAANLSP